VVAINFGIIDYGAGNLGNVKRALIEIGASCSIIDSPREIESSSALILPGVGSFAAGMQGLKDRGLVSPLLESVRKGKPLLGICLGMQLLFAGSEEAEGISGLELLPGRSRRFSPEEVASVPHVGWNEIDFAAGCDLERGLKNTFFYFVHSYYIPLDEKTVELASGISVYGKRKFVSALSWKNITALQPHPEKSGKTGLKFLKNYVEEVKE